MKKFMLKYVLTIASLALLLFPLSCQSEKGYLPTENAESTTSNLTKLTGDFSDATPFRDLTEKPVEIKRVSPKYPQEAKDTGIEGTVVIRLLLDETGKVIHSKILKSIAELNDAAMVAANQFEFKPGKVNGTPVKVSVVIPFAFKLK